MENAVGTATGVVEITDPVQKSIEQKSYVKSTSYPVQKKYVKPTGYCHKAGTLVETIAIPVLIGFGTALCTFNHSKTIRHFIGSYFALDELLENAFLVGSSLVVTGTGLYLKKLWNQESTISIQESEILHRRTYSAKIAMHFHSFKVFEGFNKVSPTCQFSSGMYKISHRVLNKGSIKTIRMIFSEEEGLEAVSELSEKALGSCEFEVYRLPNVVLAEYQKIKAFGLGLIYESAIEGGMGERVERLRQPLYHGKDLLESLSTLTYEERHFIATILAKALQELHEHHLLLKDIKPENVALDDSSGYLQPKFLDLDLLCFGDDRKVEEECQEGYEAKKKRVGTPDYWAPELFVVGAEFEKLDQYKFDVWAFGWVLYFLFVDSEESIANTKPYFAAIHSCKDKAKDFRINIVHKGDLDSIGKKFLEYFKLKTVKMFDERFEPLRDILKKFLEPDPTKRCTMANSGLEEALEAISELS